MQVLPLTLSAMRCPLGLAPAGLVSGLQQALFLELETLRELGRNGNARIYIGFEKHLGADGLKDSD